MGEKKETGFFGQIKNQIITTVGVIITAAGGLVVTNIEAIFGVQSEPDKVEIKNEVSKTSSKDTIVVIQKQKEPVVAKPAPPKKKKEFEW